MRKLLLALALLLLPISVCHASSTVTASARQYTRANSEYFSLVDNASISTGDIDFSFAGWVYITSTANQLTLFPSKWQSGALEYVLLMNAGGALKFYCTDSSKPVTGATLSTATWYFIYVSHDSVNDLLSISVNDGAVTTAAYPSGVTDTTAGFTPGANFGGAFMDGRMGPWGFWKKKLSSAEITSLYNSGTGKLYKDLDTTEKTSLISYWDGAETSGILIDAHGTNHLSDTNTVTSAAGKVTYTAEDARSFDDANSESFSITNAAQTGLTHGGSGGMYVAGWIYLESNDSGTNNYIVSKAANGSLTGWEYSLRYSNSGNAFELYVYDASPGLKLASVSDASFEFNRWTFFEFWVTAATSVGVSINRGTDSVTAFTSPLRTGTLPVIIGDDSGVANDGFWNGRMSNIVFCDSKPTDAERNALYNRGFGVHYSDRPTLSSANYVTWLKMDEASGDALDSIGSNNFTDNNTVTVAAGVVYDAPAVSTRGRVIMISNARLVEDPVYA